MSLNAALILGMSFVIGCCFITLGINLGLEKIAAALRSPPATSGAKL